MISPERRRATRRALAVAALLGCIALAPQRPLAADAGFDL
jgi:hypothetical protein